MNASRITESESLLTPAEVAAMRDEYLALARPGKPLPPGKTWADMVIGQWPGDETDEEHFARTGEHYKH